MSGHEEANVALVQSHATICFALSLIGLMASLLFLQLHFGPTGEAFGSLPLLYSAGSIVAAVAMYLLSVHFERQSSD